MNFAIIDLETTDGKPADSRVIEIAVYISDGSKIIDEFTSLVNPETEISSFIEKLTGIKNKMVKDAPVFSEIADKILEITSGCIFVAHNVSFDYRMLRNEFRKINTDYRREQLCTIKASRKYLKNIESYSLGKLCRSLDIKVKNRHRAAGDALATAELFHLLMQKSEGNVTQLITSEFNLKKLNPNLQIDSLDEYPHKKGLIKYYNEVNQVIYLVYSENIHNNLKKVILNSKSSKSKNLLQELTRIDYEVIESEILGSMTEFNLKNILKPKYNRISKNGDFSFGIFRNGELNTIENIHKTNLIPSFELRNKTEINRFNKKFSLVVEDNSFMTTLKYQEKLSMLENRCFILQEGRNRSEKTIFLIDRGELIGHGFIPVHLLKNRNKNNFLKFIQYKTQSAIESSIALNYYLLKDPELITF